MFKSWKRQALVGIIYCEYKLEVGKLIGSQECRGPSEGKRFQKQIYLKIKMISFVFII